LVQATGGTWDFGGLTFQRKGKNGLKYWVRTRDSDGTMKEITFDLARQRK